MNDCAVRARHSLGTVTARTSVTVHTPLDRHNHRAQATPGRSAQSRAAGGLCWATRGACVRCAQHPRWLSRRASAGRDRTPPVASSNSGGRDLSRPASVGNPGRCRPSTVQHPSPHWQRPGLPAVYPPELLGPAPQANPRALPVLPSVYPTPTTGAPHRPGPALRCSLASRRARSVLRCGGTPPRPEQ
jgi:hypothetical protein